MSTLNDFSDITKKLEEEEKAVNPGFVPLGAEPVNEEREEEYFDTNTTYEQFKEAQVTEVARFLANQKVYELTLGVDKGELLTFANNSLNIPKKIGYRELKERDLLDLLKGIDVNDFLNAKKTYFPSTTASIAAKEGVKSIISLLIEDATLSAGNHEVRNVVDLARQSTTFEIQRVLKHLDTKNLFNEHITVPHKRYEASKAVEIFVNTTVVLLAFLGLRLEDIDNKFSFSVKEDAEQFIVNLQKL